MVQIQLVKYWCRVGRHPKASVFDEMEMWLKYFLKIRRDDLFMIVQHARKQLTLKKSLVAWS